MKEIIFAGFGGQGVLTAALAMAYTAMTENRNVTWLPSYGAAMRGGKANSTVKFGDTEDEIINVPMMAEADVLIAMNQPSLDYLKFCKENALLLVNMDAVPEDYPFPEKLKVVKLHCAELAYSVNNPKGASIVVFGALMKTTQYFSREVSCKAMCEMFAEKGKQKFEAVNIAAFNAGYDAV